MKDTLPITIRAKQKLEEELKRLLQVDRPEVIHAIEMARANGDLTENADYDAAKERQGWIEGRIQEIQNRLVGAEVIDPSKLSSDRVIFGSHVVLMDLEINKEATYQIVGPEEADIQMGRLNILSPLARSLVGKRKGDIVEVKAPNNHKEYEITKIFFK